MAITPDNFVMAMVRLPCNADRYAEKKLQRLALEVLLAFGEDAEVVTLSGTKVEPLRR